MVRRLSPFLAFAGAFGLVTCLWLTGPALPTVARVAAAVGCVAVAVARPGENSSGFGTGRAVALGLLAGCAAGGGADATGDSSASVVSAERVRGVVRGRVTSGPEPLRRGWSVSVDVDAVDGEPLEGRSTVRLFVPADRSEGRRLPYPGDRVEVFARLEPYPAAKFPGRTALRRRMARRGIVARGVAEDVVEFVGRSRGWVDAISRRLARLRVRYVRRIYRFGAPEPAGYAATMTAGTRGLLTDEQVEPFQRTGTGHLLAISGLHLGILAALLWKGFGWIAGLYPALLRRWGRRRVCALPVVAVLGAYVWAIGSPVSAFRSFLMVAAVVVALAVRRPVDSLHGLAAAGLLLVAGDPWRICRLGFQLSFAATASILWFLERRPLEWRRDPGPGGEEPRTRRWTRRTAVGAAASLSATLATWPVLLAWNGWVPIDAVWVNLLVTPLASAAVVPVMFGGAALSFAAPAIGGALLETGGRAISWVAWALDWVAEQPPGAFVSGRLPAAAAAVVELGVFVWIGSRGRPRALATGAVAVALGLAPGWALHHESGDLRIHFIPVGQGDATLVEFPQGGTMLVDAGGRAFGSDPGRRTVAPYLRRIGLGELDWVVATHADVDHLGGIPEVAERLPPDVFLYDPGAGEAMRKVAGELADRGARLEPLRAERRWRVDGVSVRVLRPRGTGGSADNDRSLVTVLEYGGTRVLLPADIEAASERELRSRLAGPTPILKVPHHGSKTSSTPAFLDELRPRVAVVSAGRFNPFGHPHPSVERRYRRRGIEWFETARHGLVRARISTDGSWSVRSVRPPKSVE